MKALKVVKFIKYFVLLPIVCLAQIISTNTDTLYFSGEDFDNGLAADTLIIWNNANSDLVIDSIYSIKPYCYELTYVYQDSLYTGRKLIGIFDAQFRLKINDSLILNLSNPTLERWCLGYSFGYFEDTIVIATQNNIRKDIFSYGYDFGTDVWESKSLAITSLALNQNSC